MTRARERRHAARVSADQTPWHRLGLLRPGQQVVLINVSARGALVESHGRMKPGTRTELQLVGLMRRQLSGRIHRCRVTQLDPLRFEGAIVFDEQLDGLDTLVGSG